MKKFKEGDKVLIKDYKGKILEEFIEGNKGIITKSNRFEIYLNDNEYLVKIKGLQDYDKLTDWCEDLIILKECELILIDDTE